MGGTELHLEVEVPQQTNEPRPPPPASKRAPAVIVGAAGTATVLVTAVSAAMSFVALGVSGIWRRVPGGTVVGCGGGRGRGSFSCARPDLRYVQVEVLVLVLWFGMSKS